MAVFRPVSKSTKVSSDHNFCWSSSRETTLPGLQTNSRKTRNGCSWSLRRMPFLRSSPSLSDNSKGPKRKVRSLGRGDSVAKCEGPLGLWLHDTAIASGFERTLPVKRAQKFSHHGVSMFLGRYKNVYSYIPVPVHDLLRGRTDAGYSGDSS